MLRWEYVVASHLNMTLTELRKMSVEEFTGWVAFLTLESEGVKRGRTT
jgi:hypothetical protein